MKNILQLFKKMQPRSYYGAGIAVKEYEDKTWREEDLVYTSNTATIRYSGCTVETSAECQNVYSSKFSDRPIQGIGLMKARKTQ
jgi:hypothetical protein